MTEMVWKFALPCRWLEADVRVYLFVTVCLAISYMIAHQNEKIEY